MTMPYPRGLEDRLEALERRVEQLFASIQNRQPITTASAGWKIPNQGLPSSPSSGGHLTASGAEPMWTGSDGSTYSLKPPPPFTPASDPGGMSGLSTPDDWPSTYDPTYGERVQDDLQMIRLWVLQLRSNMLSGGLLI
ncbi:hypothetical protein E1286_05255 [Nonomuraea terrae]|uniref:Uncharacterized protein n=1 Tax=Nonomuraea terrae TaxID=2530383 RepID=A0A4R4Z8M2_9ACTN|nr:hypothetical protein [Nonomuraea terrae]TDD54598.1 hypothetical protein E1286_05255 [Nonomuraea terrae]